jgi:hypothetical protein
MNGSHAPASAHRGPPDISIGADTLNLILSGAVCILLGGVLGVAAAHVLRHRKLAWTWGSVGLLIPLPVVAAAAVGLLEGEVAILILLLTATATIACLTAGIVMRVEDRRAGSDREIAIEGHRGVLDPLRRRAAEWGNRGVRLATEGLPIGRTRRGELATITRGRAESGSHVLIPGATGAGKTTSLAALLAEYVVRSKFGAVVLEAKVDRALQAAAERAAAARGVAFHCVSPDGPSAYDPLEHGSVDERSERLIAVESWGSGDADFYRQAASPFLRLVLRVLERSGKKATLPAVAYYCNPDELENLAFTTEAPELVEEITAALSSLRADELRAISGLQARLRNLAESEFARSWLNPERSGMSLLQLREAIKKREVVYFRFDTDRTGNVGRAIAQMVLLDLGAAASASMGAGVGTFVAVDEFGALEASALDRLYARGRAAGFSVAVGTQTLADLRAAGTAVRERIAATVSSIVCHRIGEQADAEWVAQLIGAVPTWQNTIRTDRLGISTDQGTRTRGYRFEVNPSMLQRLEPGEVYVARLDDTTDRRTWRAKVVPAWQRLPAMPRGGS